MRLGGARRAGDGQYWLFADVSVAPLEGRKTLA
jgi:hypothetical protein